MSAPSDLKYLQTHEWHRIDGETATIGITKFAADELTDVTFVSLPKVGTQLAANARFGEVESVKATSDLYTGVGGTVTEVNESLSKDPSLVNTDPYNGGWMIKLKLANPADADALLGVEEYLKRTGH
jgi:glycine cleavage system H protein